LTLMLPVIGPQSTPSAEITSCKPDLAGLIPPRKPDSFWLADYPPEIFAALISGTVPYVKGLCV
jgi:hypothetical protein